MNMKKTSVPGAMICLLVIQIFGGLLVVKDFISIGEMTSILSSYDSNVNLWGLIERIADVIYIASMILLFYGVAKRDRKTIHAFCIGCGLYIILQIIAAFVFNNLVFFNNAAGLKSGLVIQLIKNSIITIAWIQYLRKSKQVKQFFGEEAFDKIENEI